MSKKPRRKNHRCGVGCLTAVLVLIIVILLVYVYVTQTHKKRKLLATDEPARLTSVVTQASLEKFVKEAKLYTLEYPYNGYVKVYTDDKKELKYSVAYKGSVKAGINTDQIQITLKDKAITVTLPPVMLEEPTVDVGSLDYIFDRDKYDNEEGTATEAYHAALKDLKQQIEQTDDIRQMAAESAESTEKAFIETLVNRVSKDKQYTVTVVSADEEASNEGGD